MLLAFAMTLPILLLYLYFTAGSVGLTLSHGFAPLGTSIALGFQTHSGKCGCTVFELMLLFFKVELTFASKECVAAKTKAKEQE